MNMERKAHFQLSSFTPALHPHYDTIKVECEPWILAFVAPVSNAASQFWLGCEFPLFCSLTYAHCATQRVVALVKLLTWFFVSDTDDDDLSVRGCETDHVGLRHDFILACYSGKPLHQNLALNASAKTSKELAVGDVACNPTDDHVGVSPHNITKGLPALHDIWKDISPHLPLKVYARYLDAMRDHLNANRLQAHYRKTRRLPGIDEYLYALRRPTSLVLPCLILIEYALGIELDDETVGSEMMVQLLDAVTDHVALANDVYSCETEIKIYGNYFNLPSVILQERAPAQPGFTFAEALNEAVSMVQEVDKQCVQLIKKVESSRLIEKPGVPAYLRGLESWMAGNVEWSVKTARYSHTCSAQALLLPVHAWIAPTTTFL